MAWTRWQWPKAFRASRLPFLSRFLRRATQAPKLAPERDTFCVLAWNHLQIAPNGTVKMCCNAGEDLHDGGRPLTLYTDTYDDIWNSDYMRDARRGMAQGERISCCQRCYDEEDSVGQSKRTSENLAWQADTTVARQELIASARSNEWRVLDRPSYLQLNMGSLCNLACRMCSSQYSSRIENDPVHSKWMPAVYPVVARWRGRELHIGPRQILGVTYTGFHDYEVWMDPPIRWSSGSGTIKLEMPEGTAIEALHLSLRPVARRLSGRIRVNGLEVFRGKFSAGWAQRFELAGHGEHADLEIEIESATKRVGGRVLGVGLLDAWIERSVTSGEELTNARALTRYSAGHTWWAQPEIMFGEILGEPHNLRSIIFQGGEPFLVEELDHILDVMISTGSASEVTFQIVSNLTTLEDSTLSKLARLKQVSIYASIDGIGKILEYIRYPAIWKDIECNLDRFTALPNAVITFTTAIQAYNLGDVVNILSYCDKRGIDIYLHFLVGPFYLNVAVLPQAVRCVAIQRITAYLACDTARPANRTVAQYAVRFLQEHLSIQYRDQFPSFVKFTNDMDVSRGQSFRAHYPELIEAFATDGLEWTDEARFAHSAHAA